MRILILTGHFGMGHVSAARAIKEELEREYEGSRVDIVDLVNYLFPKGSKLIYRGFDLLASRFHGIYNMLNRVDEKSMAMPLVDWFVDRFERLLNLHRPDLLVSTWPVGSRYIGMYKKKCNIDIPLITCITDISAHSEWLAEKTDAYVVGDEESKEIMVRKGIVPERIFVGGIPTRMEFKKGRLPHAADNDECREVLIMGGGLGLIPDVENMLEVLGILSQVHVTVITGHNDKLLHSLYGRYENADIIGYTDKVADYMRRADILISKAGGITLFEAIYSGTPLFVIRPFLEQEKNNAVYIEKKGIGMVIDYGDVSWNRMCEILMGDNDELQRMNDNMQEIRKNISGKGILAAMKYIGFAAKITA